MKLKGGAFYYAIFIMIIVGILLSTLIIMKSAHQKVRTISETNYQLVHANEQGINYGLNFYDYVGSDSKSLDFLNNEIELLISKKYWGFLTLLNCKSIFKKDTLTQSYFIAKAKPFKKVLYLSEQLEPLKLTGNTEIIGNCNLPNLGYRFHNFNNYEPNNSYLNGIVGQSSIDLPLLNLANLKQNDNDFISQTIEDSTLR